MFITLLFIGVFLLISKYIGLHYKNFTHKSIKLKNNTVDVFLPVCGEDYNTIKNTWNGVKEIDYQHKKVYVLDDKGDEQIAKLAEEYGFYYINRPVKNLKKAGNLKFAFDRTDGEFILILDADFKPKGGIINTMLTYMNENVGIVQSPQCFGKGKTLLEDGARVIQEYFYKYVQVSRNRFNGAICVGSCALYRRAALNTIGGTAQKEHSEDVWTGFKLISSGWKIEYIPIKLSEGVCPDTVYPFFKQQIRWCTGSLSLATSKEFWYSKLPIRTKLCYISGFLFYLSNPIMIILPLLSYNIQFQLNIFIVLSIIITFLLLHTHIYKGWHIGTIIAFVIASWAYTCAIVMKILRIKDNWQPTGAKLKQSIQFKITVAIMVVYCILLGILVLANNNMYGYFSLSINVITLVYILFENKLYN